MLRDHILGRKRRERQTILIIALFVLLVVVTGLAVIFGMDVKGIIPIIIVFILAGYLTHLALEHI